jgi:hypothetical protein
MSICSRCGTDNTADSNFCRHCGTRLMPPLGEQITHDLGLGGPEHHPSGPAECAGPAGTVLQITSDGDRQGEIIGLAGEVLTIGRTPESDLFLDDITVSRHHARIVSDSGTFFIVDLDSLNGTYVNRKRIERHQLFDGDELQIGKFRLAFMQQRAGG